jgi:Protein of unknown function (DUF3185)
MQKLVGIICLVAGGCLLLRAHQVANSIDSQFQEMFTGSPAGHAATFYLGGAVLCAAGFFLLVWQGKWK